MTTDLLPVSEAIARVVADVDALETETVAIADACGRVLADDVAAKRTQPPFDASAMDGYAVRSADISATPAQLRVVGTSVAGARSNVPVQPGEAVRIFTGAPMPAGADAVLIQEDAERKGDMAIVATQSVQAGQFVRKKGLDFTAGAPLLARDRDLSAADIALAAAANHAFLPVRRRPVVALLSTGDELVPPGTEPGPDQIVASNNIAVAALARAYGADIRDLGIAPDDRHAIAEALNTARCADIVVTLGGASVGEHDLVRDALHDLGMTLDFWRIAMRPGKPLMFGRLSATRILGLPGNPVSSFVCARIFLRPLISAFLGLDAADDAVSARLGADLRANDRRQDYLRATLDHAPDGSLIATPFARQDSSMLALLAQSDALVIRPPHANPAKAGDKCAILPLRPGDHL